MITQQYLIYTLGKTTKNITNNEILKNKCLSLDDSVKIEESIIKIYRIYELSSQVYFQSEISNNSILLGDQYYYGKNDQFFLYNFENQSVSIYAISSKLLFVTYQGPNLT